MKLLKKIILSLFLFNKIIFANEDVIEGFEALFLKIASEAFFSEYEDEKNTTYINRDKIKNVEKKLQILYQKMEEFQEELVEIKNLKKQLQVILNDFSPTTTIIKKFKIEKFHKTETLKTKDVNITKKVEKINKLRLISSSAKVRNFPFLNSEVTRVLKRDEIIIIDNCDSFGWCKIKDKEEYIQKYLFLIKLN